MNEQSIGTARIDIVANTSTMEPGVAAARRSLSGLSTEASAQFAAAAASQKTMAEGMVKQINLIDKSRLEQIAYNAQLKIGGQLGQEIAAAALAKQGDLNAANAAALAEKQAAQEAAAAASLAAEEAYQQERATIQAKWDAIRLADEAETDAAMSARAAARAAADVEAAGVDAAAFNAAVQAKQAALVRLDAAMAANLGTTEGMVEAEAALDEAMGVGAITANEQAAAFAKLAEAETLATEAAVAHTRALGLETEATVVNGAALKLNSRAYAEFGVLAGELASGNTSRLKFTLAALGNQTGLLKKAMTALRGPLGLVVVGLGAATISGVQAEKEISKLTGAIFASGQQGAVTATQLERMVEAVGKSTGSYKSAAAALEALVRSGKYAGSQYEDLTRALVNFQSVTGGSLQEGLRAISSLNGQVGDGLVKVNGQYHFLTEAVYSQITALQAQGETTQAQRVEQAAFADSVDQNAADIEAHLDPLATAWDSVAKAAAGAWHAMGQGTRSSANSVITGIETYFRDMGDLLDRVKHPMATVELGGVSPREYARSQASTDAANKAATDPFEKQATQTLAELNAESQKFRSAAQKRADEIAQVVSQTNEAVAKAVRAGDTKLADELRASGAKLEAEIASHGVHAAHAKAAGSDPFASLNSLVQSAQVRDANFGLGGGQQTQQVQAILALVDAGAKLIQSGKDVARVQADVATGVTAVNDLYAKQADQLKKHNVVSLDAYRAALAQQVADKQKQIDLQVASIGMGAKEIAQQQALNAIYTQVDRTIEQLQRQRSQKGANTDYIDGEIAAQKASIRILAQQENSKYAAIDKAQSDWLNGAKTAYADYVDQAANTAGLTQTLFTNAFKGMEDALVNFATTGKLNFKSLVTSILTDLERIIIKIELSKALQSIMGGAGSSAGLMDLFSFNAIGSGLASGGPAAAGSIHQVNEVGPELLTTGGKTYLMMGAEGGVVTPFGGARSSGGAAGGQPAINVTIQTVIQPNGSQQTKATSDGATNQLAKQLGEEVKSVVNQQLVRQSQPNGILWKMMRGQTA